MDGLYIFCSMHRVFKDLWQCLPTLPIKSLWICVTAACLNMSGEAVQCVAQWPALLTPPTATRVSVSGSSNVHLSQLSSVYVLFLFFSAYLWWLLWSFQLRRGIHWLYVWSKGIVLWWSQLETGEPQSQVVCQSEWQNTAQCQSAVIPGQGQSGLD